MNLIKSLVLSAGTALLITSCAQTSNNPANTSPATSQERAIANRVFQLVNNERAKRGKKPLKGNRVLNNMAQKHSKFQASSSLTDGKPSHFGTQNRAQYAYLKHGIENLGEIIYVLPASNSDPAATTVRVWEQSVEHSRHLNSSWDLAGIGVYKTPTNVYFTMLVGVRPGGVPRSMQPRAWH